MTPRHDALYRAICEHPDEDTPRLAYADWLDEHGHALEAEFVRTQIELAKVPEYDPLWAKCRQVAPNAVRGWGMAHMLPKPLPAGFDWRHHAFRRGFPWLAGCTSVPAFARSADALFARAPVQALAFGTGSRRDIAALARSPHLARLRRLEFSGTSFDAEDVGFLCASEHAANLTELAFEQGGIDADGLQALAGSALFARLEGLELRNTGLPPALLVDALGAAGGSGNLRRLSLPFNHVPHIDADNLFHLPVMRNLEYLDAENNTLGVEGVRHLAGSGVVRGLRVLKLAKTYPGVPGVRALAEAGGLAGVRWLDLSANRLGPVAARLLAESRSAHGLRVLNLSDNPVEDKGAVALAESPHLAGLVELDLSNAGVGDDGAIALAESPHLDGLLRLDLRNTARGRPLGDDAREALQERFGVRVAV